MIALEKLRISRDGDEASLKRLWKIAFGDDDSYIEAFFNNCYRPGSAIVAEIGTAAASAIYVLDAGSLNTPEPLPCSYSYALATLPEYSGLGLGEKVTRAAIAHSFQMGYKCNIICPADESLFPYYEKMGYKRFFKVRSSVFSKSTTSAKIGSIAEITGEEYGKIRKGLLPPLSVFQPPAFLEHQSALCTLSKGALVRLNLGEPGCAAVERSENGKLFVKELLIPEPFLTDAMTLICDYFSAKTLLVRTPQDLGKTLNGSVADFALAVFENETEKGNGYFSIALD